MKLRTMLVAGALALPMTALAAPLTDDQEFDVVLQFMMASDIARAAIRSGDRTHLPKAVQACTKADQTAGSGEASAYHRGMVQDCWGVVRFAEGQQADACRHWRLASALYAVSPLPDARLARDALATRVAACPA